MQKSIERQKKDLRAKRRELKGAQTKERKSLSDLETAKAERAFRSVIVDRESKYIAASRVVGNIEDEIKSMERTLMGNWAPKSWGKSDAM